MSEVYAGGPVPSLRRDDGIGQSLLMSVIAFAIRLMSAGIAFASQIVLARVMGQYEYGVFVFVWVIAVIAGSLSCLGLPTTIIRLVGKYEAAGRVEDIRGITRTVWLTAFLAAGAVASLTVAFLWLTGSRLPAHYLLPLLIGAAALPMLALGDAMDGTARANRWVVQALTPTYLVRPLLIVLATLLAVGAGWAASAVTALTAALVATAATTAGQWLTLARRLVRRYGHGPRRTHLRTWTTITLPIFMVEGFCYLLTNADTIMVGLFLAPDRVAAYFAAAKIMALAHFVIFAVKAGMTPRFSVLVAEGRLRELARCAHAAARWTFWPSLAAGALAVALGPMLLNLFGPDFADGYPVMVILFAGITAKALVGPGETLLMMAGRQGVCALIYSGALILNVLANLVLIPPFGIAGAAAATAFAMAVEALALFAVIRARLGIAMWAFARLGAGDR